MQSEQLEIRKEIYSNIVIGEIEKVISTVAEKDFKMSTNDRKFYRSEIGANGILVKNNESENPFPDDKILPLKTIMVDPETLTPELTITYNVPAIVATSLSLLGSVVGVFASPFTAGCSAIAGLIALTGSRRKTNLAEGGVVFILATSSNNRQNRNDLKLPFSELCGKMDGVEVDDFNSAFISLLNQGCIKVEGNEVILVERIIIKLQ